MTVWWGGGDDGEGGGLNLNAVLAMAICFPQVAQTEESLKMSRGEGATGLDCLRFYCSD